MTTSYNAASAYSSVEMETGVSHADPHRLILMLFEGAILAVSNAIMHLDRKETAEKGAAISHAISIIDSGLNASIDLNSGGEIAQNLSSLYQYMSNRLLLSNLNNDRGGMEEVRKLLIELKGAWEEIGRKESVSPDSPAPEKRASISYGQF